MALTETEKNLLLGFGVSLSAGLTVAAIIAVVEGLGRPPLPHSVSISATRGGATDPAGFFDYDEPTTITATAITFEGYEFKGWYLNGEFAGVEETFSFIVEGQNVLIASFEEIGGPPLIPAYVKPIQSCATVDRWDVEQEMISYPWPHYVLHLRHMRSEVGWVKFKICDAAGNGVPGQRIALYSDPNPDPLDYGYVKINGEIHEVGNPLILESDGDGVVTAFIVYSWVELNSDYRTSIGTAGKVHWVCIGGVHEGDTTPIADGMTLWGPCHYTSFTRLRNPVSRNISPIHAYWVNNPGLPVWGDAHADCMVKLVSDKSLVSK